MSWVLCEAPSCRGMPQELGWALLKDPSLCHCFAALVVRFLTRRFIGDYEANTGEFCSPLQPCRELPMKSALFCDCCTLQASQVVLDVHKVHIFT